MNFFQLHVGLVKQRKTPWNIFENLMKDFSYLDTCRLKDLNAILFAELTPHYSNIDKFRYLNSIFLSEFKKFIQRQEVDYDLKNEIIEDSPKSMVGSNFDRIIEKEGGVQIVFLNFLIYIYFFYF